MSYPPIDQDSYLPGTILKVRSTRFPAIDHYGGVDWYLDDAGRPAIWHAPKNDVFRCTAYAEFSSSEIPEVVWIPRSYEQQVAATERFKALEGTPWNLFRTNCEQQIRWAIEGTPYSTQLGAGILIAALGTILLLPSPQEKLTRVRSNGTYLRRRRT
jgi:hypothetical protein